jgi:hypothetical protein
VPPNAMPAERKALTSGQNFLPLKWGPNMKDAVSARRKIETWDAMAHRCNNRHYLPVFTKSRIWSMSRVSAVLIE